MKHLKLFYSVFLLLVSLTAACQTAPRYYISSASPAALQDFFSWEADRIPLISAHRGGPRPGFPENCLATFERTLRDTYAIIECDVRMTADSVLVLLHDEALDRTTTGEGLLQEQTFASLQNLKLKDNQGKLTNYAIPTLQEVLHWARGKTILTLDVKRGVPAEKVVEIVKAAQAEAYALVITYSLRDAKTYYELDTALMQSVSIRNQEDLQAFEESGIPYEKIIVFTGVSKYDPSTVQALHQKGVYCILGTMWKLDKQALAQGTDVYKKLLEDGIDILATDEPSLAAQVCMPYLRKKKHSKRAYFK